MVLYKLDVVETTIPDSRSDSQHRLLPYTADCPTPIIQLHILKPYPLVPSGALESADYTVEQYVKCKQCTVKSFDDGSTEIEGIDEAGEKTCK